MKDQFSSDMEFLRGLEVLMREHDVQIVVGAYGGLGKGFLACASGTLLIGEDEDIDADRIAEIRALEQAKHRD